MKHQIHTPTELDPPPYPHEVFAAKVVSSFFGVDVTFIERNHNAKSADLRIGNIIWEIRSPIGDSKRTMQNNLGSADNQSPNIIINLVRCRMRPDGAVGRIRHELGKANSIKRLFVIFKNGTVLVMK